MKQALKENFKKFPVANFFFFLNIRGCRKKDHKDSLHFDTEDEEIHIRI